MLFFFELSVPFYQPEVAGTEATCLLSQMTAIQYPGSDAAVTDVTCLVVATNMIWVEAIRPGSGALTRIADVHSTFAVRCACI